MLPRFIFEPTMLWLLAMLVTTANADIDALVIGGDSPGFDLARTPTTATVIPRPPGCTDSAQYRVNGNERKDCQWAGRRKTEKRCNKRDKSRGGAKVKQYCRYTCFKKCKTRSPTQSPTGADGSIGGNPLIPLPQECNDQRFAFEGELLKDCNWVREKASVRCPKPDVAENCPSVCDNRCTCENSKKDIPSRDVPRKCARIDPEQHCGLIAGLIDGVTLTVREWCPKKCDYCYGSGRIIEL